MADMKPSTELEAEQVERLREEEERNTLERLDVSDREKAETNTILEALHQRDEENARPERPPEPPL